MVKKAPTYDYCPPSGEVYYAPGGQREKIVSWKDPKASDSDGKIVRYITETIFTSYSESLQNKPDTTNNIALSA